VDIFSTLVADGESANAVEPRQRSFNHSAVATKPGAGIDTFPCDLDRDMAMRQCSVAAGDVIRLFGMQLGRPLPSSTRRFHDWRDGVEQILVRHAVMTVRSGQERGKRNAGALVMRWRFVPGLPRSVGFGPTAAPPFLGERWRCPDTPDSNRCGSLHQVGPRASGAGHPKHPPAASPADGASR
jgi:hypothetical protein